MFKYVYGKHKTAQVNPSKSDKSWRYHGECVDTRELNFNTCWGDKGDNGGHQGPKCMSKKLTLCKGTNSKKEMCSMIAKPSDPSTVCSKVCQYTTETIGLREYKICPG